MKILAIETSCDDTGIAIIEMTTEKITILANQVNTQTIHAEYGGVFPKMAKIEHMNKIQGVYESACTEAGIDKDDLKVDAIAVTVGPGLEPSLWVGITFAVELSKKFNIPILPVNHMEGHLLSPLLPEYKIGEEIPLREMPENAISLLVSGGHTQLIEIKNYTEYKIIGTTVDDAVGEAFDKIGRMMNLPYPSGPAISKLAEIARKNEGENTVSFPRPMLHSKDFNFSFSGLKTAVLYHIRDNPIKNEEDKMAIACEFENAAMEVIIKKTVRAITETGSTHLLLGGGVAANTHLQRELARTSEEHGFIVYYPVRQITGDNALMIGMAGYFNSLHSEPTFNYDIFKANGNLKL